MNVTKEYIEIIEIDKIINEDKEIRKNLIQEQENPEEQKLNVAQDRILFSLFSVILGVVEFLLSCRPPSMLVSIRILDKRMTETIRKIVNDDNVFVYMFKADVPNAFNTGTPEIYYTDRLVKDLRLTEDELISACLHEYGHYAGGHMRTIRFTNTATGIVIPILVREITRVFPDVVSYILGRIIAFMVNSYLRVKIGRPQEYFSDSYAAKHGYGKPLVSLLTKLDQFVRKINCKDRSKEECDTLINNAAKFDEHPTTIQRVDNILKNSKVTAMMSSGRFELFVRFLTRIRDLFSGRR